MKYFIITSFEIDGHSSTSVALCENARLKQQYLNSLLYDEEKNTYYPTRNIYHEDDGSTTMYGEWECGNWSINILPFKTYKEITNKERYTRTG